MPLKERERLLRGALAHLFSRSRRLLEAAERTVDDATTDELTRLRGLLFWLAWDCGVSFDSEQVFHETSKDMRVRLYHRAVVVALSPFVAVDVMTQDEARQSLGLVAPPTSSAASYTWLERSIKIGMRIAEAVTDGNRPSEPETPRMGDLASIGDSTLARVIIRASGATVRLLDFGERQDAELAWSLKHVRQLRGAVPAFVSSLTN